MGPNRVCDGEGGADLAAKRVGVAPSLGEVKAHALLGAGDVRVPPCG